MKRFLTFFLLTFLLGASARAQELARFVEPKLEGYFKLPFENLDPSSEAATGREALPAAFFSGAQILLAKYLPMFTSDPTCSRKGQMYMNTASDTAKYCTVVGSPGTWINFGSGGAGISTLNSQTGATQTFANDTNVTIASATNTHTLGWAGTLAVARGGTASSTASGARTALGLVIGTDVAPVASPTFTGTVIIPTPFTLGAVSVLPTGTELNFVDGVTSAIQTQLDGKQAGPLSGEVTTSGAVATIASPVDFGAKILELPNGITLVAGDCDAAGEAGRVFIDTDATSGQRVYVCEGVSGWVLQGGSGTGITSLEGQTGATQTFTDDSNVTIVSAANAHAITWVGTLAIARGGTGQASASDIVGTSNQVTVTGGASKVIGGGNVTLATPQNIHTAATPQFAALGLGEAAPAAGLELTGKTISTDADLTVGSADLVFTITKNDVNTRTFSGFKLKPTFNTGGSNTTTTVNILDIDSANTALTGLTVNLAKFSFGGTEKARIESDGDIVGNSFASSSTAAGQITLSEPSGTGTDGITVKAPASVSASYNLELPGTNALGFFRNDGAGAITYIGETGSANVVRSTSPTITTPTISGAVVFPDNVRQTFDPGATTPGLNVGSYAGDPSTPSNGDLWYDSTANELTARINGVNTALGAGGGGSPGGSGTELQYRGGASTFNAVANSSVTTQGDVTLAPSAHTTGSPTFFKLTSPADTTLTASAESVAVDFNTAAIRQFAAGALTTQRETVFRAPTYGFVGASTITNAATVAITGAPIAGTNATITNAYPLWVQAGVSRFDGGLNVNNGQLTVNSTGTVYSNDGIYTAFTGAQYRYNEIALRSSNPILWSDSPDFSTTKDTGIERNSAGVVKFTGGVAATGGGINVPGVGGDNGQSAFLDSVSENLTLSTVGATTDTTIDLPAGSIIFSVTARITTTITTATDWKLGDATIADRFSDANATLTAGTTTVGINQWKADRTTAGQGGFQSAAAKVRVTTTGTPGAGAIRITIHYLKLGAPTS